MTDSMKFGPEWLRNMSNDMSTGSGVASTTGGGGAGGGGSGYSGPLGPRFQQAEYRYGREEMLSLYEKNIKLPEILPSFKKLFVDKIQLPLALSPSTEEELVLSAQRPWVIRSPVNFVPTRGATRGGSVDRGRGRSRGVYHNPSLGFQRPTAMYDEDIRGVGRGDRGWPERNGANEIGGGGSAVDWNGSPSSSPRKEYSSHGRGSNMENWRRNRVEEEGDGWRGVAGSTGGNSYRWPRSASWRDEDSTNATSNSGTSVIPPITRSFSSSGSVSNCVSGGIERGGLHSTGGMYKSTSQTNSHDGGGGQQSSAIKTNTMWDQDDMLPEWAMENPTEGGGSFDASGAFHGPNEENDRGRQRRRSSDLVSDGSGGSSGAQNSSRDDKLEQKPSERKCSVPKNDDDQTGDPSSRKNSVNTQPGADHQLDSQPALDESPPSSTLAASLLQQTTQLPGQGHSTLQHAPKIPVSELSDRMQEVADDMVEKLIMDDELTMTMKTQSTPGSGASNIQIPLLKANIVTSNSPTGVSTPLLQHPLQVHSHPMMVPQPTTSNELWYYRDPQNEVQGPFTGAEMAEWYRSDYFDENLFVRRVCDSRFATLGELVKMCGNSVPFISSHLIPPLQITPVVPLGNQPGVGIQPGAQSVNVNPAKPPNIVSPIMGGNNVLTSLNMNLQFLQKEYLVRQQNMILSKLSSSEPFTLLSPERQQQILNQHMAQVSFPDNIVNLQAFASFLYGGVNPANYGLQQMMPGGGGGPKADLGQVELPGPLHNSMSQFIGGHGDFPGPSPLHSLIQGNSAQPMVQSPQPQHQTSPVMDDSIKNFLRQLQIPKGMQPATPLLTQNMGNKWPPNIMQHPQQQSWPTGVQVGTAPVSMWEFDSPINAVHSAKPDIKAEKQILEEQRQQQHETHSETLNFVTESEPNNHQPQPPPILQPQSEQLQQRPIKKSEENIKGSEDPKLSKPDDSKKASKGGKLEKKEVISKPKQTEEDRKKDAVEERKKHKEEKKRQQLEEEKKRQQAQDEEMRRQLLEEKKRLEEIDLHRRAKMLEHTSPKPPKQSYESSSRISSSVAPWSNSGLPGITTPAANLAEIQKAERERRTEEQRLEQHLEHQRKSQQMEMLVKAETSLKWNAQPIKSINVKSLAEIQAEEHKQQLAYEQAAAIAAEQSRRNKDDVALLCGSQSQSSFFGGVSANVSTGSNSTASGPGFGSIWSTRPSSLVAWNGKAWSTTSNAGFWEEPTKISAPNNANMVGGASNKQGPAVGGGNRMLSKSQTISNMQTSIKNNNQTGGAVKQNSINSSNSTFAIAKPGKANNQSQGGKGSNSGNTNSGGQQQNNGGKKDDARNEFTSWCIKALSSMKSTVDVPTFIGFLQDIESPYEVKDYIRMYLGETKECSEFGKQFLERRSKYKNQQRAQNAHIDDMCSPAPAINPSSNDFQEVKGKGKKVKKNKMTKLDARILGFSVTAAQDRINVGARDYGDNS